jgi:hypothetical protein
LKTLTQILLSLFALLLIALSLAYLDGTTLPVDHTTSITATISAPPARVFSLITNVVAAPAWRPAVKSVQLLPPDQGHDHWIEHLSHGVTMDFIAVRTDLLTPEGHARRDVFLSDPSFGGTWTYDVSAASNPSETILSITETGYIHPPLYRFMMAHVLGMTRNLDQYMTDMKAAVARP